MIGKIGFCITLGGLVVLIAALWSSIFIGCNRAIAESSDAAHVSCRASCEPNRGLIHDGKCFCSNDWKPATYAK